MFFAVQAIAENIRGKKWMGKKGCCWFHFTIPLTVSINESAFTCFLYGEFSLPMQIIYSQIGRYWLHNVCQ